MQREPLKVLLIDHDDAFASAVAAMLATARESIGQLTRARSLNDGLALLVDKRFDITLLEYSLPDGAGLANIALLKAQAPRIPIMVVGDTDDETIAVEAMQVGAQDYLVKNQITTRWLLRSIRYAVERHQSDTALMEAEEKYRGIFDHLVEGIFQTTPEGRYLVANAALARIYGYASPNEMMRNLTDIGRNLYVKSGRREEFVRAMHESDMLTGFESQIYRKDGSVIWISENCHAVRGSKGTVLYYEGTVEDITQRREAEERLRASEGLYHSLVETMPQNIFRKDILGRYTFVNPQFCRTLNKTYEEVIGKTIADFLPPELAKIRQENDDMVMESKQNFEAVEESQFTPGERGYIRVIKMPIFDADGKVTGIQGMFWDITKERRMEESLRNSEALYHSLVETLPQNVFRKDLDGRFTFANQHYCQHYKCTLEEILGKTDFDFFPRELAEQYKADDDRVMASGRTYDIIEEHQPLGREKTFVQVVKSPLYGTNGKVIGLQGIFWDITQQKQAEARIRKANEQLAASREALHKQNLRMQDDLKMASEIQRAMLPQHYPAQPGNAAPGENKFQFTHRYLPSGEVGGDFFNVSALSDTAVCVFICDVAGHGVRSALVTAMIRALVEELKPVAGDPGAFLTKLNSELRNILQHTDTPLITTAFYLVADAATGVMRYANAGHPKPLHINRAAKSVIPLKAATTQSQPALGIFSDAQYLTSEIMLASGDLVMLFTDGLYEVHSTSQELYTQEMLSEGVHKHLRHSTAHLFDKLLSEVRDFAEDHVFDDDVCLVGIELTIGEGQKPDHNQAK